MESYASKPIHREQNSDCFSSADVPEQTTKHNQVPAWSSLFSSRSAADPLTSPDSSGQLPPHPHAIHTTGTLRPQAFRETKYERYRFSQIGFPRYVRPSVRPSVCPTEGAPHLRPLFFFFFFLWKSYEGTITPALMCNVCSGLRTT